MRILHVISTLAPSSGGPTQVLKGLVGAQASIGHEVTICTTNRGSTVEERLSDDYFRNFSRDDSIVRVFPALPGMLLLSPRMARWLSKSLRSFDIVHIHSLYRFPQTCAAWLARRQGMPYVISPHGALDPYLYVRSTTGNLKLKRLYERWFDLPNLHAADAIHYTAEDERDRATFLKLESPSFVVPNGIDWQQYHELPKYGAFRADWRLGDRPIILFLGRLHFKKGLDLLVSAFGKLRRNLPSAQLVIVGPENDGYGTKVRQWVKDRELESSVHFLGPLYDDNVVRAYVDADLFVLPSYTENFGLTVIEALACGLPVVISDQVNIHREVTTAGAGLVTRCDADEIACALEELLLDPSRRREMGVDGRCLVRTNYTWPTVEGALTREYEAVIERHTNLSAGGNRARCQGIAN